MMWLSLALGLAAVEVMFKGLGFVMQQRRPESVMRSALDALRAKGPAEALRLLANQRSMESVVVRKCLDRAGDGAASVEEHRAAIVEQERQRYEKRLAFLGTLGNNAPFIGLFTPRLGSIPPVPALAPNT